MIPTSFDQLLVQAANLIRNAFTSIGGLVEAFFEGFIKISPLADEIDFLLLLLLILWLIYLLYRWIARK